MKKFSKTTAIVLSVIIGFVMIVGFLFTYIPMTFGSKTWVSFYGALNVSSDVAGGMYGEFNILTENATETQLVQSMQKIKDVFDEDGYKNVNIYAVGKSKLRVEVGYPKGDKKFSDVYSEIANVAGGAFSLRSTKDLEEGSIVLQGSTCVKDVKVFTNNDTKYISIMFNEEGQEVYKKLANTLTSSGSIYLVLGDYSQSVPTSGQVTDFTQLTLSDSDYTNLVNLEQKIKIGCMDIEVDPDVCTISTMGASYSNGSTSSAPEAANFLTSTALVMAYVALAVVAVIFLAVFAAKFGLYAIMIALTAIFNSYLLFILMCLIPSIEIGLSGIVAMTFGFATIYTFAYNYASRVTEEYLAGKSLSAALETAYNKLLMSTLIANLALFAGALLLLAFSFGELTSVAIILAIMAFLSLLTNLVIVPFLIKICNSFDGFGRKLFMLPKRANFETQAKEEN